MKKQNHTSRFFLTVIIAYSITIMHPTPVSAVQDTTLMPQTTMMKEEQAVADIKAMLWNVINDMQAIQAKIKQAIERQKALHKTKKNKPVKKRIRQMVRELNYKQKMLQRAIKFMEKFLGKKTGTTMVRKKAAEREKAGTTMESVSMPQVPATTTEGVRTSELPGTTTEAETTTETIDIDDFI